MKLNQVMAKLILTSYRIPRLLHICFDKYGADVYFARDSRLADEVMNSHVTQFAVIKKEHAKKYDMLASHVKMQQNNLRTTPLEEQRAEELRMAREQDDEEKQSLKTSLKAYSRWILPVNIVQFKHMWFPTMGLSLNCSHAIPDKRHCVMQDKSFSRYSIRECNHNSLTDAVEETWNIRRELHSRQASSQEGHDEIYDHFGHSDKPFSYMNVVDLLAA